MKYNFDEIVVRSNTRCAKYDERIKKFGSENLIPLWIADMDFKTAEPIIVALKQKAEEGIYGYVSRPDSYFKAACDWKKRRNNWEIEQSLCSFSLGVVPAMTIMAQIWCKSGSNILIQPPVYGEFFEIVKNSGNNVLTNHLIEKDGKWSIDWEDFETKIKEVSMFLFCTPHNPLGIVWEKEEIERVVNLCAKNNVILISDEIHSDLIFHDKKFIPTATVSELAKKTVVTCFSATKTFNLAGLQACTVVFPNNKLKVEFDKWWLLKDIHRNNSFSSVAMEVAYNEGEEWLEQLLPYLSSNFDFVVQYCKKNIPKIKTSAPDATYLMWLDCRALNLTNEELDKFMIQKAKLGLSSGSAFDKTLNGFMRLNAATPKIILEKALKSLKKAVDELD
ncbi:MalY/PatB family protein [Cetobacterium sp.]|uniref:MalY/PatB family protein n=1 Tax=Cetobacterium sp. TaxID=2071632 RepID=UPI003F3003E6